MALRPFLKWVGGKRQLLPVLRRFYPANAGRYYEPFVGSGAVFFDLLNHDRLNGGGAVLSDGNADLIACYRRIADSLDVVLATLDRLAADHGARGRDCYLEVRDQYFNPQRLEWRARGARLDDYTAELAAMVIYLNRTGYNGLFRQNASGLYNVPPGRYDRPRIVNHALLTHISNAFSLPAVRLEHAAFDSLVDDARAGDFVYFDPPYAPLSRTANFRGYTGRGFSEADQVNLQQIVIGLATRGVHVLLSNSVAPSVSDLYEGDAAVAAAGLQTFRFPARRSINSRPDRRGVVEELVVSNVVPPA
ncbi:MAG: Dam family site-specific DNA-(adenine-N6)-methyltransferase [Acidobacteriota bacterium]